MSEIIVLIRLLAALYGVDPQYAVCIAEHESAFDQFAVGDHGQARGLWQWHEDSIRAAMRHGRLTWDWQRQGDPRLDVAMSTAAAMEAMSQGWDWWSTDYLCEGHALSANKGR